MLRLLNIHMQKNEARPLPHTVYKNKLNPEWSNTQMKQLKL